MTHPVWNRKLFTSELCFLLAVVIVVTSSFSTKYFTLWIVHNIITKLDAYVFKEAPTLEHINLHNNLIETIHRSAFDGLPLLQNIYLHSNKIANMHPNTFTHLVTLKTLNLQANTCINKQYINASNENSEIVLEIGKACKFNLTTVSDVVDILIMKDSKSNQIHQTMNTQITKLEKDYSDLKVHQDQLQIKVKKTSDYSSIYNKYIKNMIDAMNNND